MLAIYPAGFSSLVISLNIAAVKCHSLMMKYKNNKWFWPLFALFWWLRLYFPWSSSLDQSLLPAEKNIIIISTAEWCSYKRFSFPSHTHYPTHPSTKNFWAFKPVYTKAFRRCDYKFKIGTIRMFLSENTFAGHWETVVDCMENIAYIVWSPKSAL